MKMNFKLLMVFAGIYAMFASCTSDEILDRQAPEGSKKIAFNASFTGGTRAAEATTSNLTQFYVTAKGSKDYYMKDQLVTNNGGNWTYENTKYWGEENIKFFAWANHGENTPIHDPSTDKYKFVGYKVSGIDKGGNPDFQDLLVAYVEQGKDDLDQDGNTEIKFDHALTEIVVRVAKTKEDLEVTLLDPILEQFCTTGNCTWGDNLLEWDKLTDIKNYNVKPHSDFTGAVKNNSNQIWFGDGEDCVFFIPQEDAASGIHGDRDNIPLLHYKITIKQKLENIDSGINEFVTLVNNKDACIPLLGTGVGQKNEKGEFKAGYKYIYTLYFDNGGGYEYPFDDPENPKPILKPIKYKVDIVDYKNQHIILDMVGDEVLDYWEDCDGTETSKNHPDNSTTNP